MRKNFTPSERIAILENIEKASVGKPLANSRNCVNYGDAAKAAGFGSGDTARRAAAVVENGTAELLTPPIIDRGNRQRLPFIMVSMKVAPLLVAALVQVEGSDTPRRIAVAIADLDARRRAACQALTRLAGARVSALLIDDDAALIRIEREADEHRLAIEKLEAAIDVLRDGRAA